MRRLPVYFLLDVSESMIGTPIENVQNGMRSIIQELRSDPYALETAFISVIAFAGKPAELAPLTELYKFYPPMIPIGGGTSLGIALDFLMDSINRDVKRTTLEEKGDWKPIVFLFTDGNPTDNPSAAFDRWNREFRRRCNLVVVAIGNNVDTSLFGEITENVIRFNGNDTISYKAFFKWISDSIRTSSMSVADLGTDQFKLAPVDGVNLEKVNTDLSTRTDENFAVILGKCSTSKQPYLIKYAKRETPIEGMAGFSPIDFKLVGAFGINEESYKQLSDENASQQKINIAELSGEPSCPCCGNRYTLVLCECGNIFCAGDNESITCPWCNKKVNIQFTDGTFDVGRTNG